MSSPLEQLHADLLWAARHGGELAGHAAVQTGVDHADSAPRALANVESVNTRFAGPLDATVTAAQPGGISPRGPVLPSSDSIVDAMAAEAVRVGHAAAMGGHQ